MGGFFAFCSPFAKSSSHIKEESSILNSADPSRALRLWSMITEVTQNYSCCQLRIGR